jgi:hypothetical protein
MYDLSVLVRYRKNGRRCIPGYYAGLGNNWGFWLGIKTLLNDWNIPQKKWLVNILFSQSCAVFARGPESRLICGVICAVLHAQLIGKARMLRRLVCLARCYRTRLFGKSTILIEK